MKFSIQGSGPFKTRNPSTQSFQGTNSEDWIACKIGFMRSFNIKAIKVRALQYITAYLVQAINPEKPFRIGWVRDKVRYPMLKWAITNDEYVQHVGLTKQKFVHSVILDARIVHRWLCNK